MDALVSGLCLRRTPIYRPETLERKVTLDCMLSSAETEVISTYHDESGSLRQDTRPCRTMPLRLVGKLSGPKRAQIDEMMSRDCALIYLELRIMVPEQMPLYWQLQSLSDERFSPYHCSFPRAVVLNSHDRLDESCGCALLAAVSVGFHLVTLGTVWWCARELTTGRITLSIYDFEKCRFEFGEYSHPFGYSYPVDLSSHTLIGRPVPTRRTSHRFSNGSVLSLVQRRRSLTIAEPDPEEVTNALQNFPTSGSLPLAGASMEDAAPSMDVLVAWESSSTSVGVDSRYHPQRLASSTRRHSSYTTASSDPSSSSSPPPPRPRPLCRTTPMDPEAVDAISKPTTECVVCCATVPNAVLFPCLHRCLCAQCATKLIDVTDKCPLCRRPIEEYALDLNRSP